MVQPLLPLLLVLLLQQQLQVRLATTTTAIATATTPIQNTSAFNMMRRVQLAVLAPTVHVLRCPISPTSRDGIPKQPGGGLPCCLQTQGQALEAPESV